MSACNRTGFPAHCHTGSERKNCSAPCVRKVSNTSNRKLTLRRAASSFFSRLAYLAQPFRISCHMLSISMNYVIARSTSQQTCASFKRRMCLFGDHPFSFTTSGSAADHQFHHPKRNYGVCFNRQHHQGSELPPPHCRALIESEHLGVKAR
jgi:hypothetical protein